MADKQYNISKEQIHKIQNKTTPTNNWQQKTKSNTNETVWVLYDTKIVIRTWVRKNKIKRVHCSEPVQAFWDAPRKTNYKECISLAHFHITYDDCICIMQCLSILAPRTQSGEHPHPHPSTNTPSLHQPMHPTFVWLTKVCQHKGRNKKVQHSMTPGQGPGDTGPVQ